MKKILIFIFIAFVIFIFSTSIDGESNKKTLEASKIIVNKISVFINQDILYSTAIKRTNLFIRNCAHFLLYFFFALVSSLVAINFRATFIRSAGYILFICLLVANLDEFLQGYVNRTSQVSDCLLDLIGACFGILFTFTLQKVIQYFKTKIFS